MAMLEAPIANRMSPSTSCQPHPAPLTPRTSAMNRNATPQAQGADARPGDDARGGEQVGGGERRDDRPEVERAEPAVDQPRDEERDADREEQQRAGGLEGGEDLAQQQERAEHDQEDPEPRQPAAAPRPADVVPFPAVDLDAAGVVDLAGQRLLAGLAHVTSVSNSGQRSARIVRTPRVGRSRGQAVDERRELAEPVEALGPRHRGVRGRGRRQHEQPRVRRASGPGGRGRAAPRTARGTPPCRRRPSPRDGARARSARAARRCPRSRPRAGRRTRASCAPRRW